MLRFCRHAVAAAARRLFGSRWYLIWRPLKFRLRYRHIEAPAPSLSLVVATYNVAEYIDAFFNSLTSQRGGLANVEIIVVDDGSTDDSGRIADTWATRFPDTIKVIHQNNSGVCAARNIGLAQASGDWISFPDPDDFLSPDYLEHIRAEILRPQDRPLLAVAAHMVFYYEKWHRYGNDHALRYRFSHGIKRVSSTDPEEMYLAHTTNTFMRRADIIVHGVHFDANVRPSFEDADFVLRLMLAVPDCTISFLPAPVYFYRKRAAATSQIDAVTGDPDWYGPHLRTAYLALMRDTVGLRGHVPRFIQHAVLQSLSAKIRHLMQNCAAAALAHQQDATDFYEGVAAVLAHVEDAVIDKGHVPGLDDDLRRVLAWYKGRCTYVYRADIIAQGNAKTNVLDLCIQWWDGAPDSGDPLIARYGGAAGQNSREVNLQSVSPISHGRSLWHGWLTLEQGDRLSLERAGRPVCLHHAGKALPHGLSTGKLMQILS
jgi:GT2 family glycosyltransferase